MSIFEIIIDTLKPLNIPVAFNENLDKQSSQYVSMIPIQEGFIAYSDNKPGMEIIEVELAVYTKGNYIDLAREITRLLIEAGFTIRNRKYIEFKEDTKLHHYVIDVAMEFCY